ncbi:MAG: hypothetical protein ACE15E_20740 [Acidobacteriota bacterium]
MIRPWALPVPVLLPVHPVITNETAGNQTESILVVDFRRDVKKVGLNLLGGQEALQISVTAASPAGGILGTLTESIEKAAWNVFIGLEASDNQTISKVIIDYKSAETPEQLLGVTIDSPQAPRFETVLPQVAHGQLGPDLLLRTAISIVNLSNTTNAGEISFFSRGGEPLEVRLQGFSGPADATQFRLYPTTSGIFVTSGNSPSAGYARVVSRAPVQVIAHFQLVGYDRVQAETAVPSVGGRFTAIGAYDHDLPPSGTIGPPPETALVSTALAIVNIGDKAASISLQVREEQGGEHQESLDLMPGEQMASFIGELIGGLHGTRGTVRILSNQPLAAILIKTVNGLPVSILPLGSMED